MYNILIWKDHAINPNNTYAVKENPDGTITLTPAGEVLQQGTNMSATNFNNMEFGIADADLASIFLFLCSLHLSFSYPLHDAQGLLYQSYILQVL